MKLSATPEALADVQSGAQYSNLKWFRHNIPIFINQTQALTAERFDLRAQVYVNYTHEFNYLVLHATYSTSF